jgi:uncharacterized membrane protein
MVYKAVKPRAPVMGGIRDWSMKPGRDYTPGDPRFKYNGKTGRETPSDPRLVQKKPKMPGKKLTKKQRKKSRKVQREQRKKMKERARRGRSSRRKKRKAYGVGRSKKR